MTGRFAHLPGAWLQTVRRTGGSDDIAAAGARLIAAYAEPARHYHGLSHLDDVLRQIDDLATYAGHADTVRLAGWFHDAVYDPRASDNEERSARMAESALGRLRLPPPRIASVARLVRLTVTHDPGAEDADGAVLCDADLAVLAGDPQRYASYTDGIRAEYAHLDDATFAAGRSQVLRALLARPSLYRTPYAASRWERPARENVGAELARLSAVAGA